MILPNDEKCRKVVTGLDGDPELSQWEADFIASNRGRLFFTDKQKEIFGKLLEKFDV